MEGGVGGQFWSVYVPASRAGDAAVTAVFEQVDLVHRMIAAYPNRFQLALTADDVDAAFKAGKIASLLGAEGGHCINSSLGVLRSLHALGVRYLTLTHNDNVGWADSATDEPDCGGLSDFGRDGRRRRCSASACSSTCRTSRSRTMNDALDVAQAPVIFSHSSARALTDNPRNVPDDVLARLAVNGGVCMVAFVAVLRLAGVHRLVHRPEGRSLPPAAWTRTTWPPCSACSPSGRRTTPCPPRPCPGSRPHRPRPRGSGRRPRRHRRGLRRHPSPP